MSLHKPVGIMMCFVGSMPFVQSAPKGRGRSACQESMMQGLAPDPTQPSLPHQLCSTGAVCAVDFHSRQEALARDHLHLHRHEWDRRKHERPLLSSETQATDVAQHVAPPCLRLPRHSLSASSTGRLHLRRGCPPIDAPTLPETRKRTRIPLGSPASSAALHHLVFLPSGPLT